MNQSQQFKTSAELRELNLQDFALYAGHAILQLTEAYEAAQKQYKCFHCGEVFTDESAARIHFGTYQGARLICSYKDEDVRKLENALNGYRDDDSAIMRQMLELQGKQANEVRRAEELGYSRGLKDYTKLEQERDQLKAQLETRIRLYETVRDENSNLRSQVKSLTRDKEMLDWLENFHYSCPPEDELIYFVDKSNAMTIRQAITSAMQKESK